MLGDKQSLSSWIDGSLYPDTSPPAELNTLAEQVDFLARLCGAWDFGLLPKMDTVVEIRRPHWRKAVDACRLLTSPAYHIWLARSPCPPDIGGS